MDQKLDYKLDADKADEILQNVLKAGNRKPSSVAVSQIAAKKVMTKAPYSFGLIVASIALALTLLAPLAFVRPFLPVTVTTSAADAGLTLEADYAIDGILTLKLSSSDVDPALCYMQSLSGEIYEAVGFNEDTREIRFRYPSPPEECNIYIVTKKGAALHLLLTPQ